MAKHEVKCRVCGEHFDTGDVSVDWIMPARNFYYHRKCYEIWQSGKNDIKATSTSEEWFVYLKEFLYNEARAPVNFAKLQKQWDSYIRKGKYTAKGIYFAMKYFLEHGGGVAEKSDGIGIIPYIYEEAAKYWYERNKREEGICEKIEEQLRQRNKQEVLHIHANRPVAKQKKKIDFSLVEDDE